MHHFGAYVITAITNKQKIVIALHESDSFATFKHSRTSSPSWPFGQWAMLSNLRSAFLANSWYVYVYLLRFGHEVIFQFIPAALAEHLWSKPDESITATYTSPLSFISYTNGLSEPRAAFCLEKEMFIHRRTHSYAYKGTGDFSKKTRWLSYFTCKCVTCLEISWTEHEERICELWETPRPSQAQWCLPPMLRRDNPNFHGPPKCFHCSKHVIVDREVSTSKVFFLKLRGSYYGATVY